MNMKSNIKSKSMRRWITVQLNVVELTMVPKVIALEHANVWESVPLQLKATQC